MKAALYGRFTTDKQRDASIDDQFRECERVASAAGLQVVARFEDKGISGGTHQRPGYQALLAAARRGEFSVIVVEDISRLWRSRAEFGPRSAELEDLGVHCVTCVGDDTRRDGWGLVIQIKQAVAEHARRETSYRTRRGLEGRARSHKSAGGRAFGYTPASQTPSGEREINQEQAGIVRNIFEWYANGKAPRWIAGELNRRGVASPGSTWRRTSERLNAKRRTGWVASAIHGDRTRGTGILNNPLYAGEVVWGRSVWKRSAADSKRRRWEKQPDRAATVRYSDERLRIVSADMWERVQARQRCVAKASDTIRKALHRRARTGRQPRYLLTGLLRCGKCGAGFVMNGPKGYEAYACGTRINSGSHSCDNHIRIAKALAETRVIEGLQAELLTPRRIELFKRTVRQIVATQQSDEDTSAATRKIRLVKLDAEIDNLVQAISSGLLSPTVRAKLEAAETEKAQLEKNVGTGASLGGIAKVTRLLPRFGSVYTKMVGELVENMRRDVDRARQDLAGLFGRLTLNPDSSGRFLIAEGRIGLGGVMAALPIFGNVVAGAGYVLSLRR